MTRILFIAEAATLAHVSRPAVLGRQLTRMGHEVVLARPSAFSWMTRHESFTSVDLDCQSAAEFARRLDAGKPLYDFETLLRYVEADQLLMQQHRPDIVIGDFRLSLSVSARLQGVPYATLCDAYWSPEAQLDPALPVLPFTRFTPIRLAETVFRLVAPVAFRLHARPMEKLRQHYGMPGFRHDLRQCYTDADLRLFANPQPLFPEVKEHAGARFLGPVAWSPDGQLPENFPSDKQHIYVSMGSSGSMEALKAIAEALRHDPRPVVIATAGRPAPSLPSNNRLQVHDYLPGAAAMQNASLVICNGGSPTTNQALSTGVPVLGIPTNMDQFLNMRAIQNHQVGLSIRADRITVEQVGHALQQLQAQSVFHARAASLAREMSQAPGLGDILETHVLTMHQRT